MLVNEQGLRFEDVEYAATDEDGDAVTQVAENVRACTSSTGGQLEFVQVFTDHSVNGYAICKTEALLRGAGCPGDQFNHSAL